MPNGGSGIALRASSSETVIGSPGHGNVISGNMVAGIRISGGSANDVIQANLIGVNAAGNAPLPNQHNGIYFAESGAGVGTLIGGSGPGEGNVISANGFNGVDLSNGAHDVTVQGNLIGTHVGGTLPLGNGNSGVIAHEGAHDNTIGGTAPGERNVIAFNHIGGVGVNEATSVRNTIRGNSIHSNWHEGIALWDGGNLELPAPVIASLGPVTGTACADCIVDVYSDSEDEGRIYEGSTVAGGSGSFTYSGSVSGPAVTATATDSAGNTSRFSDRALLPGVAIVHIDSAALPPGGETSTVNLWAFDVPPPGIGAFIIDIAYDPDVVMPTACDLDPDHHFDGSFCNANYTTGTVRVVGFCVQDCADGNLRLATITFQAVAPSCCSSPLMPRVVELTDTTVPNPIPAATESGGLGIGIVGDANRSGVVSMADAMMIAQVVVGLRPPEDIDQRMANVNCSGGVSMVDAMLVAQNVVFSRLFECSPCANDGWMENPANHHYYKLTTPLGWPQAEAKAVEWGGHLVTVNDREEELWLRDQFGTQESYWIGFNDLAAEGNWVWASGEPVTYTNWADGEPNNYKEEDAAVMNCAPGSQQYGDCWNDVPVDGQVRGIVEASAPQ